jgi:uncharacterized protein (DUF934 family)
MSASDSLSQRPVVIDNAGQVIDSVWTVLAADQPWTGASHVIVPLERLAEAQGAEGVLLSPAYGLQDLTPYLGQLKLIAVSFPKFRDGRGFTQARALREHLGFTGDIRAVGHVLPDQYLALLRCGVSTVELAEGQDPAIWAEVLALRGGLDTRPVAEQPVPLLRRLAASFQV